MRHQVKTSNLRQGDIVYAELNDGRGSIKRRPAVVVSYTEDICAGDQVVVAAITKRIPDPLPPTTIVLPYSPNGNSRTQLTVRCAVVANWLRYIEGDLVETKGGYIPDAVVAQLLNHIDAGNFSPD